jgi:hypothetical protein
MRPPECTKLTPLNSCVDWTLPLFNRNLSILSSGYDVYLLQKALVREG